MSDGRYSNLPEAPRPSSWRTDGAGAPLIGRSSARPTGQQAPPVHQGYDGGTGVSPAPTHSTAYTGSSSAGTGGGGSASYSSSQGSTIPNYSIPRATATGGPNNATAQPRTTLYRDDDSVISYDEEGLPRHSSDSPARRRPTQQSGAPSSARPQVRFDGPSNSGQNNARQSVHMDVGSSLSDSMPDRLRQSGGNSYQAGASVAGAGRNPVRTSYSTSSKLGMGGGSNYESRRVQDDEEEEDGMPQRPRKSVYGGTPSDLGGRPAERDSRPSTTYATQQQRESDYQDGDDDDDEYEDVQHNSRVSGGGGGRQPAAGAPNPSTSSHATYSAAGRGHGAQQPTEAKKLNPAGAAPNSRFSKPVKAVQSGPSSTQVDSRGMIKDEELYSDIVFLWLGPDFTTFAKINKEDQRYVLVSHIPVHRGTGGGESTMQVVDLALTPKQLSVFQEFEPIGALVYQIKQLLASQALSHLQQSLKNAVRKQLALYFEYVGELRRRGSSIDKLSLIELVQAAHVAKPQLLQLHQLLIESQTVKGGELVTKLQHLNHQGSKRLSSILEQIYLETVQPLLTMTVHWITRGEVSDPFNEFFVSSDLKIVEDSDKYWTQKYQVRDDMLPSSFTSGPIAQKILLVGKNVNFIKRCCRAKDWRLSPKTVRSAEDATFSSIASVVDEALETTNEATYTLVMEKYDLNSLLQDLRAFLLVAYDDLFDPLISRLEETLKKDASKLSGSQVDEHLQAVLRELPTWTTRSEQFSVRAVMDTRDERVKGWDAFVLHLDIPSPLNHVVHKASVLNYRKLFKVMWRAKCTDEILKKAWRQNTFLFNELRKENDRHRRGRSAVSSSISSHHTPENLKRIQDLLATSQRIGAELSHFIKNYHNYLIYEAILTSWERLQRGLKAAKSLDDLRSVHDRYQQQLMAFTLLQDECADAMDVIDNIIDCAREYCHLQEKGLVKIVERGEGDPKRVEAKYRQVEDKFRGQVNLLLKILEEQHLTFDFLHFLGLRVNFNRYYRMTGGDSSGLMGGAAGDSMMSASGGDGVTTTEW